MECEQCGEANREGARFCSGCGGPGGHRHAQDRHRTFADLVGSTSFGERTDAEVARSVMARYHALLQDAIDAHGGTVAKFMGDGIATPSNGYG